MSDQRLTVDIRVRDMTRVKLLLLQLRLLADVMHVAGSPHADQLEHILDRFVGGGDDDVAESQE